MSAAFVPMNIFNNRKFSDCYAWGLKDILAFIKEVATNPTTYGITTDQGKQDVTLLQQKIAGLVDFADPNSIYSKPAPAQQVLRVLSGGKLSLDPTRAIVWDANNNKEPYYIIFDLLGCFLSLITPIANEEDPKVIAKKYFLPLLALYAKWCFEARVSIKKTPRAVQVTWFRAKNKLWPFFGAVLNGNTNPRGQAGIEWERLVGETRWRYLKTANVIPAEYPGYDDSPKRKNDADGEAGTRYGHCAETYPFLYVLSGFPSGDPLIKSSHGMSISIGDLFAKKENDPRYKGYDGDTGKGIWEDTKTIWPPCDNCQALLGKAGATLSNYMLYK